jgi:uncharacterized membrane protein YbjE (DUF340 family)
MKITLSKESGRWSCKAKTCCNLVVVVVVVFVVFFLPGTKKRKVEKEIERFHTNWIWLLLFIVSNFISLKRKYIYFPKVCSSTKIQDYSLNTASVVPVSKVLLTSVLALLMVKN